MIELIKIQSKIRAPKDKKNDFAGFPYRNAEGILRVAKPLLEEYNCQINLSDEVVLVGDRFYIKSTVTIKNEKGETESAIGWAREQLDKKGNDQAQVTGASSSYARKYALCGLFGIDDSSNDPDIRSVGTVKEGDINTLLSYVQKANSRDELSEIWYANEWAQKDKSFNDALQARSAQVK